MRKAEKIKAEIAKQPHRRWGKRRDLQNHFKILKGEKWSIVASAIKEGTTTESGSGDPVVDITEAARQTMPIEIGSPSEWDEKLAVNNFFGRKFDDVEITDVREMLDFIPDLEKYLTAILNRKARMQALTENPIPDDRSIQEVQSPIKPDGQDVDGIQIGDDEINNDGPDNV